VLSPLSILVKIRVALNPANRAHDDPNSASSMFSDSLQENDRGLGRCVEGAARVPLLARERGDVDDHPGALRMVLNVS
jgi:hypothetical protein